MKKNFSWLAALGITLLVGAAAQAQDVTPCGTYQAMEEYMRQNPDYARQLRDYESQLKEISENANLRGVHSTSKVIPVVVE